MQIDLPSTTADRVLTPETGVLALWLDAQGIAYWRAPDGSDALVGAPAAAAAIAAHLAAADPHPQYAMDSDVASEAQTRQAGDAANAQALQAHVGDHNNPHGVTAAQAGAQPLDATLNEIASHGVTAIRAAYNYAQSFTVIGDSFSVGVGPTDAAHQFVNLIAQARGWTANNVAVSGSSVTDQWDRVVNALVVNPGDQYLFGVGFDDARQWFGDLNQRQVYQNCLRGLLSWLTIPESRKVLGSQGATTGGWQPANYTSRPLSAVVGSSVVTNAAGSTWQCQVYGTTVYLGTIAQHNNSCTFSIAIDGVTKGTYSCGTSGNVDPTTALGGRFPANLIRIEGLSEGLHTILVTVQSADGVNGVWIDWCAGNMGAASASGPNLWAMNYVRCAPGAVGYATADVISAYNAILRHEVATLAGDGLNVALVETASLLNITTDLADDKVHPSNAGAQKIANAVLESINQIQKPRTTGNPFDALSLSVRMLLSADDVSSERQALGLGTLATQDANNVAITGGTGAFSTLSAFSARDGSAYTQSANLEWNRSHGGGETYLVNQRGAGGGGLIYIEVDPDGSTVVTPLVVSSRGDLSLDNQGSRGTPAPVNLNLGLTYSSGRTNLGDGLKCYFYKLGTEIYGLTVNDLGSMEYHAGNRAARPNISSHRFYTNEIESFRVGVDSIYTPKGLVVGAIDAAGSAGVNVNTNGAGNPYLTLNASGTEGIIVALNASSSVANGLPPQTCGFVTYSGFPFVFSIGQVERARISTSEAYFGVPTRNVAYTVSTLPSTAQIGAQVRASNGRKPGEAAGAGTGVNVVWDVAPGGTTAAWRDPANNYAQVQS